MFQELEVCLSWGSAYLNRSDGVQEVTVSHNSRMDSVIATSIKEALRSRFVQNEGKEVE